MAESQGAVRAAAALFGTPARALRFGAAVVGVALLVFGLLATAALGGAAAVCPGAAFAASGTIATIYAEASPPVTVLKLRGADALEFRIAGDLTRAYARGDFVAMCGERRDGVVEAQSIRHATDPLLFAAPYLAAGAVFAGAAAADILVKRPWAQRISLAAMAAHVRLPRRRPQDEDETDDAAPGTDNNHSGAPAPKG